MTWWPIKTAPLDGSYVLLFSQDGEETGVVMASWEGSRGWRCWSRGDVVSGTHWMPVPAPPGAADAPTLCDAPTHRETPTAKREPAQLVKVTRCDAAPQYVGRVGRLRGTFSTQPRYAVVFEDGDWTVCQEILLMQEEP